MASTRSERTEGWEEVSGVFLACWAGPLVCEQQAPCITALVALCALPLAMTFNGDERCCLGFFTARRRQSRKRRRLAPCFFPMRKRRRAERQSLTASFCFCFFSLSMDESKTSPGAFRKAEGEERRGEERRGEERREDTLFCLVHAFI